MKKFATIKALAAALITLLALAGGNSSTAQSKDGLKITQSPDKRLTYLWLKSETGGPQGGYAVYAQYRTPKGEVVTRHIADAASSTLPTRVWQVKTTDGRTVYITKTVTRLKDDIAHVTLCALTADGNELVAGPPFVKDGTESDNLAVDYDIVMVYYSHNQGDGEDYVMSYHPSSRLVYAPKSINDCLVTDRYDIYRFDGTRFVCEREGAGEWLHKSLRDFKILESVCEIGGKKIRIDATGDNTYRYAEWRAGQPMSNKPRLVINNGHVDNSKLCYVFNNGNLTYHIGSTETGQPTYFEIWRQGKLIKKLGSE